MALEPVFLAAQLRKDSIRQKLARHRPANDPREHKSMRLLAGCRLHSRPIRARSLQALTSFPDRRAAAFSLTRMAQQLCWQRPTTLSVWTIRVLSQILAADFRCEVA